MSHYRYKGSWASAVSTPEASTGGHTPAPERSSSTNLSPPTSPSRGGHMCMDTVIENNGSNDTNESYGSLNDDSYTESPMPTFGNFSPEPEAEYRSEPHTSSSSSSSSSSLSLLHEKLQSSTTNEIKKTSTSNMVPFRTASTSGFQRSMDVRKNIQGSIEQKFNPELSSSSSSSGSISRSMTQNIVEVYKKCNPEFKGQKTFLSTRILTNPNIPNAEGSVDNEEGNLICRVHDTLTNEGDSSTFRILDLLGTGTFGQVLKCQKSNDSSMGKSNLTTDVMAIKIVKNKKAYYNQGLLEVNILKLLNKTTDKKSDKNIVKLLDSFEYKGHVCLCFELLSVSLLDVLTQNQFRGLPLKIVQRFMKQILTALVVLQDANIIHCDLKPENILLCPTNVAMNSSREEKTNNDDSHNTFYAYRHANIKVIDFGSACFEGKTTYSYIQSRFYRSPEVLLGVPYNGAIDLWSLGCVVAELYLGLPLFPGVSQHNQLSRIVEMLGHPPDFMIEQGKNALKFFSSQEVGDGQFNENNSGNSNSYDSGNIGNYINKTLMGNGQFATGKYKIKSAEEYANETNTSVPVLRKYLRYNRLEDIVMKCQLPNKNKISEEEKVAEYRSRMSFYDLVKGLLTINTWDRWTAKQAAGHPFISNSTFHGPHVPSQDPKVNERRLAYSVHLHNKRQQQQQQQYSRPQSVALKSQLTNSSGANVYVSNSNVNASRSDILQQYDPRNDGGKFRPLQFRRLTEPAHRSSSSTESKTQQQQQSPQGPQSQQHQSHSHFQTPPAYGYIPPQQPMYTYQQVAHQGVASMMSSQQSFIQSPYGSPYVQSGYVPMGQPVMVETPGGLTPMVPVAPQHLHQQSLSLQQIPTASRSQSNQNDIPASNTTSSHHNHLQQHQQQQLQQQQQQRAPDNLYSYTASGAMPMPIPPATILASPIVTTSSGSYVEPGSIGGQSLLAASLNSSGPVVGSHIVVNDFGQALIRPDMDERLFESEYSASYQQRQQLFTYGAPTTLMSSSTDGGGYGVQQVMAGSYDSRMMMTPTQMMPQFASPGSVRGSYMHAQMVNGAPVQYPVHPHYPQQTLQHQPQVTNAIQTGEGSSFNSSGKMDMGNHSYKSLSSRRGSNYSNSYTALSHISSRRLDGYHSNGPPSPLSFHVKKNDFNGKLPKTSSNEKLPISKSSSTNSVNSLGKKSDHSCESSDDTIEGVVSIIEGAADDQPFFGLNDLNADGEEGF